MILRWITCKCLRHLSLAWKQDYHEGYAQSSVDAVACFAPALCGKTFSFLSLLTEPEQLLVATKQIIRVDSKNTIKKKKKQSKPYKP